MNHLAEKVKDALVKQDNHRYVVYRDKAIIETNSEKKLMKILLHNFTPSIYDEIFWKSLIRRNQIYDEFIQALRKSCTEIPHIEGEIKNRLEFPLITMYIWSYIMDNEIELMTRLRDFFDQMIEAEKITLKNFPKTITSDSDDIQFFERLSDLKVVKDIST